MKRVVLYHDLAFWLLFLPLLTMLIPVERIWADHAYFLLTLAFYLVGIYAVNRYFNLPALLLRKRFLFASAVLAVMLVATYAMTLFPFPDTTLQLTAAQIKLRSQFRAQMIWFLFLIVMGFCFSFGLFVEISRQRALQQAVEAERNRAELALYKAQINPHFLFNTLNTLYGLALMQSDKMESAFVKFSEILKYMYSNVESDTIALRREVEYIEQYIDLQRLRLSDHTTVEFVYEVDDPLVEFPPMVLITFVENAFKYGVSSSEPSRIDISLRLVNGYLEFVARNPIVSNRKKEGGVGVDNCRKRLDLLYAGRYKLVAEPRGDEFVTKLEIRLQSKIV